MSKQLTFDTPRVEAVIERTMKRFPGIGPAAQARYYEAVHQELAPLARALEREVNSLTRQLQDARTPDRCR
jgi:hypothetical protein